MCACKKIGSSGGGGGQSTTVTRESSGFDDTTCVAFHVMQFMRNFSYWLQTKYLSVPMFYVLVDYFPDEVLLFNFALQTFLNTKISRVERPGQDPNNQSYFNFAEKSATSIN